MWERGRQVAGIQRPRSKRRVSERRAQYTHQGIQKESGSEGYALQQEKEERQKDREKGDREEQEKQERENARPANIETTRTG